MSVIRLRKAGWRWYNLYLMNFKTETTGSITVYLSLILLLILSLILTITEGARVATARIYAERALSTAMDSVLAEYYGPLWEEYHIFGLYTGTDSIEEQEKLMEEKLSDYMSYTFEPEKGLDISSEKNTNLYHIILDSVAADKKALLMDYQGKLLINEAAEYMKYKELGNGMELLLGKLSLLDTPQKVSYVYEEKEKAESELIEIDQGILELMELLDGLSTSGKGIETAKDNALKTEAYFVKKICYEEVTKEAVGINHEKVFLALKNSYVNPTSDFETIKADFAKLLDTVSQIASINLNINQKKEELLAAQTRLEELNASEEKTKEDKAQIKEVKKNVKSLKATLNSYEDDIKEQEQAISRQISYITASRENITLLISEMKPKLSKAISALEHIILKTEMAAPVIEQYETLLDSYQDQLEEEVFRGLEENLKEMKKYVAVSNEGYDFQGMKEILKENLEVLIQTQANLKEGEIKLSGKKYEESKDAFSAAQEGLQSYQIKGLTLDYSTLVLDNSAQNSSLSAVYELLQKGLTSLVIDPDKISEGELADNTLPSEIVELSQENTDFLSQLTELFGNFAGEGSSGTGKLFNSFDSGTKIAELAGDGVNAFAEHLLYQEYLKEHFDMYQVEGSTSGKPSVLAYEQEYLLAGKLTDQENLASVISRIIFLRIILDFVSIIGDSTRRNEARMAASAMVGFTGLPILIAVIQILILLAWSFAEALLDVNALMQGKEVPVLKKTIILQLPDLFLINRSFLDKKAAGISAANELSMSYQDYLRMFFLLKTKQELAYRSLDLMQENIRLRYDTNSFNITRCLFGYEAVMEYTVPSKFTGLAFVQRFLGADSKGFHFIVSNTYSY